MFNNIGKYLNKLNNDLNKLQKHQDNITYGLDYLFNEGDYYKRTEVKSAFDGNHYYMKVEEIKMVNYHYMNILIILNLI